MFKLGWCASVLILAQSYSCFAETASVIDSAVVDVTVVDVVDAAITGVIAESPVVEPVVDESTVVEPDIAEASVNIEAEFSAIQQDEIATTQVAQADTKIAQQKKSEGKQVVASEKSERKNATKNSGDKKQQSTAPVKLPRAVSVELGEPVKIKEATLVPAPVAEDDAEVGEQPTDSEVTTAAQELQSSKPLVMLNTEVLPSTTTRLSWSPAESFEMISTPTPVLIAHGAKPGPVLCLTAALHGDELNGIEIVRRVLYNIDPGKLSGTVIGVPIVNLQGFRRGSRYLVDRRDLNRYFPGNPSGSSAARLAHSFFTEVIHHCDALVDLHTGSFYRTNLPQLRADVRNPKVVKLTEGFGATMVLQSAGAMGTLRRAAVEAGIPAVTLEAGESMRLQEKAVEHGVKGIHTLMNQMNMIKSFSLWGDPQPVYYNSVWVRVERGGILFTNVSLGDRVSVNSLLGEVRDPITNTKTQIFSPQDGRIIGMAVNQVVQPGFAAFHVGIRSSEKFVPAPIVDNETGEPLTEAVATPAADLATPVTESIKADLGTSSATTITNVDTGSTEGVAEKQPDTTLSPEEDLDEEDTGNDLIERNQGGIDDREFD